MCKRHLKAGVSVIMENGIRENGRHYNRGVIKSRDGEYYMINVFVEDDVVLVERYLCEIRTE